MCRNFSFFLYLILPIVFIGNVLAQDTGKKIYLNELNLSSEFDDQSGLVRKNTYDIIFEHGKFELFLPTAVHKNSGFIESYSKLDIKLEEGLVMVSLSGKKDVSRQIVNPEDSLLDLRLALYELFYGKEYVEKNLEMLKARSRERMKRLERLQAKQQKIDQQNQKNLKHPSQTGQDRKEKAKKPKAGDGNEDKDQDTNKEDPEQSTAVPDKGDDAGTKPGQLAAAEEGQGIDPAGADASDEEKAATEVKNDQAGTGNDIAAQNKKDAASVSTDDKKGSKDSDSGEENLKNLGSINNQTTPQIPHRPQPLPLPKLATRTSRTLGLLAFSELNGKNKEIIDTSTQLSFVNVGGRLTVFLLTKSDLGLLDNLHYELRGFLRRGFSSKKYKPSTGKQVEAYAGTACIGNCVSLGSTFSYEDIYIGTIKAMDQGLALAQIENMLLGPEFKFMFKLGSTSLEGLAGYQVSLHSGSNIEGIKYKTNKLFFELDWFFTSQYGAGARMENYTITGSRSSLGTSKVQIAVTTAFLFYQF